MGLKATNRNLEMVGKSDFSAPVALPRKTALGSLVSLAPALEGLPPNAAGLRLSGMGITAPLPLRLQYER